MIEVAVELDLPATVDELALVNAQIAELETRATELKTTLETCGQEVIVGTLHKATVVTVKDGVTTDWKAACVAAKVKQAILDKCQKKRAGYVSVKLSAR